MTETKTSHLSLWARANPGVPCWSIFLSGVKWRAARNHQFQYQKNRIFHCGTGKSWALAGSFFKLYPLVKCSGLGVFGGFLGLSWPFWCKSWGPLLVHFSNCSHPWNAVDWGFLGLSWPFWCKMEGCPKPSISVQKKSHFHCGTGP